MKTLTKALSAVALVALLAAPAARAAEQSGNTVFPQKKCTATMEECLRSMIERYKKMGLIGIDGEWDPSVEGYRVQRFIEGSVGEAAGMRIGDVLVKVNGIPLTDEKAFQADAGNRQPGREVSVTVMRDSDELTFRVKLIPVPADVMAEEIGRHMLEYHTPSAAARQD
jgi:S1-C subfamily serine protease